MTGACRVRALDSNFWSDFVVWFGSFWFILVRFGSVRFINSLAWFRLVLFRRGLGVGSFNLNYCILVLLDPVWCVLEYDQVKCVVRTLAYCVFCCCRCC